MVYTPFMTPKELRQAIALSEAATAYVASWRRQLVDILSGQDPRLVLIVGPCSIHNIEGALEYANNLRLLSLEVSDVFLLVMRAYLEKPRTSFGWKGLVSDPYLDESFDIETGLRLSRQFLCDLAEMGLPSGTEFLDPYICPYFEDCLSWGSIGARTSQSQAHRHMASALMMPAGYKNRPDGDLKSAIGSLQVAKQSATFVSMDLEGRVCLKKSRGNVFPHLILRGGETHTNFDEHSIKTAQELLRTAGLHPSLIIDCSHDNSRKNHLNVPAVFEQGIHLITHGMRVIRGMMFESYLVEGKQELPPRCPRTSITDPCVGWQTTQEMILQARKKVLQTPERELCVL
jgi:3-deoxy-7-phosphoheptulonate synthase